MKKVATLVIIAVLILLAVLIVLFTRRNNDNTVSQNQNSSMQNEENINTQEQARTPADVAGQELSHGHCQGTDKPLLTDYPMDPSDVGFIIPYGLMIGGHVTPIDHQYFSPEPFDSPIDAYPVYAMADARIVDIGTRTHSGQGQNANKTVTDFRIVFSMSCHLFYYYDLVTGLAPDILSAYQQQGNSIDLPVKAGQRIGSIGGQTLDFAVWDTESELSGFVVPEHYERESWKIHTVDPLPYYTEELRSLALTQYLRTVEPRSGKIDYDIDGRLIGTWFVMNPDGTTNGYAGNDPSAYWTTHLAIAPDHLDPSATVISIGNWPDGASQFTIAHDAAKPVDISPENGRVAYDLYEQVYYADGQVWDRSSLSSTLELRSGTSSAGCFMVEMLESRKLRAEVFPGQACKDINTFSTGAVVYIR
ncbi:MAG: hypothetical protein H6760_02540 [Candidatus Nomurabacteria bacterium]|nr:MAG: hypothetical protein H6760_02540 [Candidatus Nomurabacteria bacterium]